MYDVLRPIFIPRGPCRFVSNMEPESPKLLKTYSSQEELLSENEYTFIKREISSQVLEDLTIFDDMKDFPLRQDSPLFPSMEVAPITPQSPTCKLPCTEDWPGPYNFEILLSGMTSGKKTWQFSYDLNKVYIDICKSIPLQFKIDFQNDEEAYFVRALPVYTIAQHMSLPVKRCPVHHQEDQNKGLLYIDHVVKCEDSSAAYEYDSDSKRYSVVVPLGRPQAGSDVVTLLYSLVCKSSCCGGMNRRPIMIIFTLEKNQQVIGRKTLNIRVCSCPKRDKEKEEKLYHENKAQEENMSIPGSGKRPMERHEHELFPKSMAKKKCLLPPTENEDADVYTIKVRGQSIYTDVLRYIIMLKSNEYVDTNSQEAYRQRQEYYDLLSKALKNNEGH